MKIVKIKGGLGNQMFQYAFAKLLQKQSGEQVKLDMSAYRECIDDQIRKPRLLRFRLSLAQADDEELREMLLFHHRGNMLSTPYRLGIAAEALLNRKYVFEPDRAYRAVDDLKRYMYFDGYWQSWAHVDKIWPDLEQDFVPCGELDGKTRKLIRKVKNENSVFVGIRRGDYAAYEGHYGGFGQAYFTKAMEQISALVGKPVFYIFSNDIAWVKEYLDFSGKQVHYRNPEDVVDDFEELMLMASCRHAIIINSTFHWWGARLQESRQKVIIAPEKWFFDKKPIDIVPPRWYTLRE